MNSNKNNNLKPFFIKLVSITFAIIIIVNMTYNIFFAEKFEAINKLMELNNKENIESIKDKIKLELKKGLAKDNILNEDDAKLLKQFFDKIRTEINKVE
jgi:hypothetical protein|tara:strand:- start:25 stop:321 length:297 start_codon:yes stop_codon:yes gene_type:complete